MDYFSRLSSDSMIFRTTPIIPNRDNKPPKISIQNGDSFHSYQDKEIIKPTKRKTADVTCLKSNNTGA